MTSEDYKRFKLALDNVLDYARFRDYAGYSKFDALNSPTIKAMTFGNKWFRGGATLFVNSFPLNIRPILGVRKSVNPKGMALFARAYLELYASSGIDKHLSRALGCLEWLIRNPSPGFSNLCWGYNFDWQSRLFYAPRNSPNCVVTVFAAESLIRAYELTENSRYLECAKSAADFIVRDLPVLFEDELSKCIGYVPHGARSKVININALSASFLAKPNMTKADNDSFLVVLSAGIKI